MFRVKICGVTSPADARLACEAGADAIGINFYSSSPRYCAPEVARQIAASIPPGVRRVGVFVNASADEIRKLAAEVPLDLVQLHGDEPPEFARSLRPLPFIKAFGVESDLQPVATYLAECHRGNAMPRMLLVDAVRKGPPGGAEQFGGTGQTIDWELLREQRPLLGGVPLVLAGGLKPDNVALAIATVRPWAVDVASGVESAPGKKAAELVRQFVAAAKLALSTKPPRG
jgi:phosphoribosylanthranilate isomerase